MTLAPSYLDDTLNHDDGKNGFDLLGVAGSITAGLALAWRVVVEFVKMVTSMSARINHNDERIEFLYTSIDNLTAQNRRQQLEIDELKEKIKVAEADKLVLQQQLAAKEEELTQRTQTIARLRAKLEELGIHPTHQP